MDLNGWDLVHSVDYHEPRLNIIVYVSCVRVVIVFTSYDICRQRMSNKPLLRKYSIWYHGEMTPSAISLKDQRMNRFLFVLDLFEVGTFLFTIGG